MCEVPEVRDNWSIRGTERNSIRAMDDEAREAEEKSAQPCGPCKEFVPNPKNKGAGLERDVTSLISVLSKYLPGCRDSIRKHLSS